MRRPLPATLLLIAELGFVKAEDPRFIARRLVRAAMEDIGSADPMSLVLANAAREASTPRADLPKSWGSA